MLALQCLGLIVSTLAAPAAVPEPSVYRGMCDASAAVWISSSLFAVASDEDNLLRVYQRDQPDLISQTDLSTFLKVDPKEPETDIEGAARLGDLVYWITSHGRNKNGKERQSRQRFFATKIIEENSKTYLGPTGQPYSDLLKDLLADERLKAFDLASASRLAPKDENGLNIEALASMPDGSLLVGFRNPLSGNKAIAVPLLNPSEMIQGVRARLGPPILLDLNGRGIRGMTEWNNGFLIVAGGHGSGGGKSVLYFWRPGQEKPTLLPANFLKAHFNPEAIAVLPNEEAFLLISDDGNLLIGNQPCKDLKDKSLQQYRGMVQPAASILGPDFRTRQP